MSLKVFFCMYLLKDSHLDYTFMIYFARDLRSVFFQSFQSCVMERYSRGNKPI